VSDIIYTPNTNQTVKFRVTGGTTGITAQQRGAGFSRAVIQQINPTIAVQATATGTLNATVGNVTLSSSYSQVVAATIPGTTIFTLPTLQPGTYLITAQAKVNGGYSAMGIFTGGSQVANTSVFSWYQASGTVNNGLQGTWVLTVTTPTVYTINAWGGGTVSAGSDGTAVANYIQINPTFALTAISGLTTTSDVNVGGNLNVTGTGGNVLTTGSISTTQNITGSVIISGSMNIITTKLQVGTGSGDEGGEILLAKSQTNNSLTGSGITIDSYQNRLRIFEQGGNARGGYFDLTTLGNGVSTNLAPTLYLLEAYADVTYTLPGSFTEDPCRYSVVNNTVNVSSSWFNTSTYTFTPQKAGYWEITATYDVYRNSETAMAIKKNNGIVVTAGSFGAVAQQVTKIVYLNGSTDFINVVNVGGAANSRSQYEGRSWFQARWVGE
jgi:hypothetical protein